MQGRFQILMVQLAKKKQYITRFKKARYDDGIMLWLRFGVEFS